MKTQNGSEANPIKEIRESSGLTQAELAKKLNVTRTALSKWENKRIQLPHYAMEKLIELFKLSGKDVIRIKNYKTSDSNDSSVADSYEKVIGYFKGALKYSFDFFYHERIGVSECGFTPFEKLSKEQLNNIELEIGKKLNKKLYKIYCEKTEKEFLYEEDYMIFSSFLKENPFIAILFQFGLFGNSYQDYFLRWKTEKTDYLKSIDETTQWNLQGREFLEEYYLPLYVAPNGELEKVMNNFSDVINIPRLSLPENSFHYSIKWSGEEKPLF